MKRIDFLGAPGVGKSSIYELFILEIGKENELIGEDIVKFKAARNLNKTLRNIEKTFYNLMLSIPRIRIKYFKNILPKVIADEFKNYSKLNPDIFAFLENFRLKDTYDISYRHKQYDKIIHLLYKECLFNNYYNKPFLNDEPIAQKIFGFVDFTTEGEIEKTIITEYFNSIPCPDILIYCYADAETIADRIVKRNAETGKLLIGHKNKSQQQLINIAQKSIEILELGCSIFQRRGVKIIKLNTTNPINESVLNIKEALIDLKLLHNEKSS